MKAANKTNKVIIDTNLWISFLIGKNLHHLLQDILDEQLVVVTSKEQLKELLSTVAKPKLEKYFHPEQVASFFSFLNEYAIFAPVTSTVTVCRDAKDNFLLALAKDSLANYLITGDKDLLVIKKFEETQIVTIAEYRMNE
ncbi:putative toxin-antitoxin system toxin component, PIN family [Bacteroidia bacterium]|nr:putative toxin-antitoxin system toxin component, PIN family [Bacteroidia bacterium]